MTTEQSLLRTILTFPQDDTVRLVYADYLEENGKAEQAEFIRLHIKLYRQPEEMTADERKRMVDCYNAAYGQQETFRKDYFLFSLYDYKCRLYFSRGFLSNLMGGQSTVMDSIYSLFSQYPIQAIGLFDCAIMRRDRQFPNEWRGPHSPPISNYSDREYSIMKEGLSPYPSHCLKVELFDILRRHPTCTGESNDILFLGFDYNKAADAVSEACVDYGRQLVGLPPLRTYK